MSKTIIQKVKESGAKFYEAAAKQNTQPNANPRKSKTIKGDITDESGNLFRGTGTGTPGDEETIENPALTEFKKRCAKFKGKNSEEARKAGCVNDPKAKDPAPVTIGTPGNVNVDKEPVLTTPQTASNIDLIMGSTAGRVGSRLNKSQRRITTQMKKKLARSEDRLKKFKKTRTKNGVFTAPKEGEDGYRRYTKLKDKKEDFEQAAKNQQAQFDNVTQQMTGMRNPYVSMQMEYDRDLKKGSPGGEPVKAPPGTLTESEFRRPLDEFAGINPQSIVINAGGEGGSGGNVTSFTELLTGVNPVAINTGDAQALFQDDYFTPKNIVSRTLQYSGGGSGAGKMLKKPSTFKMKGYGSKSKK